MMGCQAKIDPMPHFVILEHDHPHLHWDFLLEHQGALRSWRLAAPPEDGKRTPATPLPDHRLAYLDYEGPVSGNRGTVKRWDRGEFAALVWTEQKVEVVLAGKRLHGMAALERDEAAATESSWSFTFSADRPTGQRS
jgi:DNA polymerase Ligase (LigD)